MKILYLDNERIVFEELGVMYIGTTLDLKSRIESSAYSTEKVIFRCNELTFNNHRSYES